MGAAEAVDVAEGVRETDGVTVALRVCETEGDWLGVAPWESDWEGVAAVDADCVWDCVRLGVDESVPGGGDVLGDGDAPLWAGDGVWLWVCERDSVIVGDWLCVCERDSVVVRVCVWVWLTVPVLDTAENVWVCERVPLCV